MNAQLVRAAIVLGLLSVIGPLAIDMYLPALPAIAGDLNATAAAVQQSLMAFMLAFAVGQLVYGPLSDMFGRKRIYLTGMAAFTLASILCGLAPNAAMLVAARVLQGATASLVLPQVLASIRVGFDGGERRRAFGLMGLVMGAASALGQLAGGALIWLANTKR